MEEVRFLNTSKQKKLEKSLTKSYSGKDFYIISRDLFYYQESLFSQIDSPKNLLLTSLLRQIVHDLQKNWILQSSHEMSSSFMTQRHCEQPKQSKEITWESSSWAHM